jgi:hypothetical protein
LIFLNHWNSWNAILSHIQDNSNESNHEDDN